MAGPERKDSPSFAEEKRARKHLRWRGKIPGRRNRASPKRGTPRYDGALAVCKLCVSCALVPQSLWGAGCSENPCAPGTWGAHPVVASRPATTRCCEGS